MNDTKTVLWAGPQDGTEVNLLPGQVVVYIDGPLATSDFDSVNVESIIGSGSRRYLRGRYALNLSTGRFEWKGYERESGV